MIEIPPLGLRQKSLIQLSPIGARVNFDTRLSGHYNLQTNVTMQFDPKRPENFYADFSFKQDFINLLKRDINNGIGAAQNAIQRRINSLNSDINKLKASARNKEAECKRQTKSGNIFSKGFWDGVGKCFKAFGDRVNQAVKVTEGQVNTLVQGQLNNIKKIGNVFTAIDIRSARATTRGQDLIRGRLPSINIVVYVRPLNKTITIKEQLNVSNQIQMVKNIADKIVRAIA